MVFVMRKNSIRFLLQVSFFIFTLASTIVQSSFAANLVADASTSGVSQTPGFGSGSSWEGGKRAAMVLLPVAAAGVLYFEERGQEAEFQRIFQAELSDSGLPSWCNVMPGDINKKRDSRLERGGESRWNEASSYIQNKRSKNAWRVDMEERLSIYEDGEENARVDFFLAIKDKFWVQLNVEHLDNKLENAKKMAFKHLLDVSCPDDQDLEHKVWSFADQIVSQAKYERSKNEGFESFNLGAPYFKELTARYKEIMKEQQKKRDRIQLCYNISKVAGVVAVAALAKIIFS